MKSTVLRPKWPERATSDSNNKPATEPESMSRITLALLDEYSIDSKTSGYDPYNTDAGRRARRALDIWRRKPKRD
jgi:hypothetical protein